LNRIFSDYFWEKESQRYSFLSADLTVVDKTSGFR